VTELAEDEEVAYKAKDDLSDSVLLLLLMAVADDLGTGDINEEVVAAILENPDLKGITDNFAVANDSGCSSSSEPSVGPPSTGKSPGGHGGA